MLFKEIGVRVACGFRHGSCQPFHNTHYKYWQKQSKRQAGQPQREVFIEKQQKRLRSVLPSLLRAPSLWRKGEDHPTDDKVEKENGVDDESFAVWGLAVGQEGGRGWEKKQQRAHVGKTGTGNTTDQIKSASHPYPPKPGLLASPRLFPPRGRIQTTMLAFCGVDLCQERPALLRSLPRLAGGGGASRKASPPQAPGAWMKGWAYPECRLTTRIPDFPKS